MCELWQFGVTDISDDQTIILAICFKLFQTMQFLIKLLLARYICIKIFNSFSTWKVLDQGPDLLTACVSTISIY